MNLTGDDDDDNDLATLDIYSANRYYESSCFDEIDGYASTRSVGTEADDLDVLQSLTKPKEKLKVSLLAMTNPTKSVWVSALMDGRVHQVERIDKLTRIGETKLAEEVFALASLARQKARASQYTYILDSLEGNGESTDARCELVGLTLNLPASEQAAAKEEVFSTLYFGKND
ncbi:hypothetical protein [Mycobacterium lepromatosis]|uniref:ESX-1 secretion-associated protein EspH n=1 Tax=Mycobacterium lepromatosis TaxID=480418 RepID=A0A0F4ET12_9MYCO|nr:hypothetical protein [Mycobacterium lepromatosis]KJX75918.1 ESX-1 secretion-associated protein EspH [Mycobacterium lepromatosis]UKN41438.1 ESX-1 secretion-associated protein EspH [Mycobacterium lepromatosis]